MCLYLNFVSLLFFKDKISPFSFKLFTKSVRHFFCEVYNDPYSWGNGQVFKLRLMTIDDYDNMNISIFHGFKL